MTKKKAAKSRKTAPRADKTREVSFATWLDTQMMKGISFEQLLSLSVKESEKERIETANFRILASSCAIPSRTATVDSTDEQRPCEINPQRRKQFMTHGHVRFFETEI